ncbi:MAG: hybrid sensor histidine kinase/response regulator [Proteobacteria bacterium]|nr:hybrid sensor histidine kinase/response regulator [Pseudomonadota bacterium]
MALQIIKTLDSRHEFEARIKEGTFLVVDDYDTLRKVTVNQLRQLGAGRIVEAVNGIEALKALARQPFTLILSDWNMPVMNGLDLLLSVRSNPVLFRLPFVMVTADAERHRVTQAIQVGVSELLVKPYTSVRLAERLEHALKWVPRHNEPIDPVAVSQALGITLQTAGAAHAAKSAYKVDLLNLSAMTAPAADMPPTAVAPAKPAVAPAAVVAPTVAASSRPSTQDKLTILVVDDTPDNLQLLSHLFKEEYRVRIAHNGAKALSICQSDTPPDLILLDIMMPDMDGFEVAKRLREHPSSECIPIIFVTAMTDEAARLKGMELGAVDFVTKPIDPDALRVRVKNFMRYVDLHRQLQADYDGMMEAARLKEDVEHITRHDMKGPLAGVIGLVQSLADDAKLDSNQVKQLRMVEEAALQVLNMVNLSTELFKIETGRFKLDPQPVNILEILGRIVDMSRATYADKHFNIFVDSDVPEGQEKPLVLGDAMFCYSLFQNLIKNACEAAPEKSRILVRLQDQAPLRILIQNQGAVPASIRKRFFDKFVTEGKQDGTGLGTYSAKLLTEAQGGRIELAVSDEANTTSITVSLPRAGAA